MISEPWNGILFVIVIPILVQAYKLWRAKGGKPLTKLGKQVLALVLAFLFTLISGGFIGLGWPTWPAWNGDIALYVGGVISFLADSIGVIGAAWAMLSGVYEIVLKRVFESFGFADPEAITRREMLGFWG